MPLRQLVSTAAVATRVEGSPFLEFTAADRNRISAVVADQPIERVSLFEGGFERKHCERWRSKCSLMQRCIAFA